jgi:hypothetical protein
MTDGIALRYRNVLAKSNDDDCSQCKADQNNASLLWSLFLMNIEMGALVVLIWHLPTKWELASLSRALWYLIPRTKMFRQLSLAITKCENLREFIHFRKMLQNLEFAGENNCAGIIIVHQREAAKQMSKIQNHMETSMKTDRQTLRRKKGSD